MGKTASLASLGSIADTSLGFRNRIINGDMRIDQRNAGASVTPTTQYTLDRWIAYTSQASKLTVQQNAGGVTPPSGFSNYFGVTSLSAYSITSSDVFAFAQIIEGLNVADLGWGSANAQTVTLSFRVRSSLTGTFGGSLSNSSADRSYPFTYSIPTANTWTTISVTIPGDTSGTWLTTNGIGIRVQFGLGMGSTFSNTAGAWAVGNFLSATGATSVVGTSGATFYITGVQLEAGSVATPFERIDYGRQLIQCQRYYEMNEYKLYAANAAGTFLAAAIVFATEKRAAPTISFTNSPQGVNYSPGSLDWTNTRSFGGGRNSELNFTYMASAEL